MLLLSSRSLTKRALLLKRSLYPTFAASRSGEATSLRFSCSRSEDEALTGNQRSACAVGARMERPSQQFRSRPGLRRAVRVVLWAPDSTTEVRPNLRGSVPKGGPRRIETRSFTSFGASASARGWPFDVASVYPRRRAFSPANGRGGDARSSGAQLGEAAPCVSTTEGPTSPVSLGRPSRRVRKSLPARAREPA